MRTVRAVELALVSSTVTGQADVTLVQPTVKGGYSCMLSDRWALDASLAPGSEINIETDGEDVGEGAIGLVGIALEYRL